MAVSRRSAGSRRPRRRSAGSSRSRAAPPACRRYEVGPAGSRCAAADELGVACDVVAPSLIPVRAGDRVKTDRRDAKKLVSLYRAGMLRFVHPPTPELEGLRDLLRARDDLRGVRLAARNRVPKQLVRATDGSSARGRRRGRSFTAAGPATQRLDDPLAQEALEQLLIHVDGIGVSSTRSTRASPRSRAASGGAPTCRSSRASAGSRRSPRSG